MVTIPRIVNRAPATIPQIRTTLKQTKKKHNVNALLKECDVKGMCYKLACNKFARALDLSFLWHVVLKKKTIKKKRVKEKKKSHSVKKSEEKRNLRFPNHTSPSNNASLHSPCICDENNIHIDTLKLKHSF